MESQNIECKERWRDEYIKWICGFENTNEGFIYIGINDKGLVTGLEGAKKLLEEIPNKTRDVLGIMIDINLETKNKKQYLEIEVEANPYPISYKGQYDYRTGSTKQELNGATLDKFILRKQVKHWDSAPQTNLFVKDLSKTVIQYFKTKATDTKRVNFEVLKDKVPQILEKLYLNADTTYLKRAVGLLFHTDPEKFVTNYFNVGINFQ